MKNYDSKNIRNVVLLGHSGTGKTTLGEAILFTAKVSSRQGRVEEGTSIFDWTPEEIDRKISINLGVAWVEWNDLFINIIDTPGYDDFCGDMISGTRIADGGIILINATAGIQPGTLKAKELSEKLQLPIIVFVNQVNKSGVNFDSVLGEAKKLFGRQLVPVTIPGDGNITSVLESNTSYKADAMEALAEIDDSLTEKFLAEEPFTEADIQKGFELGVKGRKVIPLYSGDAYDNVGIKELLTGLSFLPSPMERKEAAQPTLSCFTFKTIIDPHFGDLKYIRVFSGTLEPGTYVFNSTKSQEEKINQVYIVRGKERQEVTSLCTGMIGALVKLKSTQTGDTLTRKDTPVSLVSVELPPSQVKIAIIPKAKKDEAKVSTGLAKLHEEDPTFESFYDTETKQTIISGIGELHLNVMLQRLKQNFGVEVELERPRIHYRETINKLAEHQGKYKRQTGGHGQYGDCWLRFEPLERGKGVEFVDAIVGGRIPKRFIPSVEKGVRESAEKGVLAGFPTTDFKVTLYDGSYHEVDSSDIAFKIAASMAFRDGIQLASPTLLEPIMQVEVIIPSEFMGDVMGELSARRGKIERTEPVGNHQKIYAIVPEAELHNFHTSLRSQTQGIGSVIQKFLYYEVVPKELQPRIIEEYKKKE